ncbi:hypothetical protein A0J61_02996 [Choanephora cucurbitarum]|uniref:Carbohydrate-binding module family 19 domain-containing protein n=1 Tax=Choanephora cucurbitarum TaxID=101091 RepID=A0A1C7NIU9_9FUNG|nr:hypothetical protein A0J61_02996 [Choanephora cucurbitarum]
MRLFVYGCVLLAVVDCFSIQDASVSSSIGSALPEFSIVAQNGNIPAADIFQPQANIETLSENIKRPMFEANSYVKLPNGNWAPSCKHVTEGTYCLKPDGEDASIVQCLGENVGFQFQCANGMKCYSAGPTDVDCIKA